jgi:hypothetical protein
VPPFIGNQAYLYGKKKQSNMQQKRKSAVNAEGMSGKRIIRVGWRQALARKPVWF